MEKSTATEVSAAGDGAADTRFAASAASMTATVEAARRPVRVVGLGGVAGDLMVRLLWVGVR
ncbi:hypothetical protein GCM10010193_26340 [Kitasatospora atroaurantiaca]